MSIARQDLEVSAMGMRKFNRLLASGLVAAGLAISSVSGVAAASGGASTTTVVLHGIVDFGESRIFCSHDLGAAYGDVNSVFHITDLGDGTLLVAQRSTGTAYWTPYDPSRPTGVGHFTIGETDHGAVFTADYEYTFEYINHGTFSDGTSFKFHLVERARFNKDGVLVVWDNGSLTCE
jgi:hypothetical protein